MLVLKGTGGRIRALAFSPDGRLLASATRGGRRITLWDLTGGAKKSLSGHGAAIKQLTFAPVGTRLVSLDCDRATRLWDAATDEDLGPVMENEAYRVHSVAFAPDSWTLALAGWPWGHMGQSYGVILWDVAARKTITSISVPWGNWGSGLDFLGFAPDGRTLATGGKYASKVQLWDVTTGRVTSVLQQRLKIINHLTYSPDGRFLAVALGWSAALWDVARREETVLLRGKHTGTVWSVAFTPDGQTLMTGSTDGTVKFWDVATGRERAAFAWGIGRVNVVAFAPDGMRAAAGGVGSIIIWDVEG
jgi:WD40 repeat protein